MTKTLALALMLSSFAAFAAPVQFKVASEVKNLHIITVENQNDVENFTGRTGAVFGTFTFDTTTKTGSGTLTVDGTSIVTGIPMRDSHMKSKDWLNFNAFPDIKFVTSSVKNLSGDEYEVKGTLSMNGKSLPITAKATVRLTKAGETTRKLGLAGDALALSTRFQVKLSDYGVTNRSIDMGRVSNLVTIAVQTVASDK